MATKKKTAKNLPVATPEKPKFMEPHEIVLTTVIQNAIGVLSWSKFAGAANLNELVKDLDKQIDKIKDGGMSSVEAMLLGQAKTLETMFVALARRAANNENLNQYQVNLSMALKCQAQCRATLEALAEVKNPRSVQFVKQANMTTGPQQVNNGAVPGDVFNGQSHAHTAKNEGTQSKLLEADHGNYLDTGAQGQTSCCNQAMEAVG